MDIGEVFIAKVCRPKVVCSYRRKRLFELLDRYQDVALTWVTGPAGSGKTTLASTYIESLNLTCIWYQIDAGDNDPATFFYYLGQAISSHLNRKSKQLPSFTPEYLFGAEVFSRRYFEEIGRLLEPPAILVFDNYQFIAAESILHKLITIGLSQLPPGLRAFILSRSTPPPTFARMKANGRLGTLTWEDLRLDLNETSAIIDLKASSLVSDQIKKEIHIKSDGWAAGLSLLWQSKATKQINHQMAAKTPEEIFDYFAEEVFNDVNGETQTFLIKSSFLTDMKLDDAITLTGIITAEDILHNLQKLNYFINQPGESGVTFRYHPLFREFLQSKAKLLLSPNELLLTRKKAGHLLERSGNIEEAISHFFSNEDFESAIPIIMQNALPLLSQGRNTLLLNWLACIPESLQSDSPWLLYWKGAGHLALDPLSSYKIFEAAYLLSVKKHDVFCQLLSMAGILDAVFYGGENFTVFDPWLDLSDKLEAEIEACPDPDIKMRVEASLITALIIRRPQHPKIEVWADRFLFQTTSPQSIQIITHILCNVAWYFACVKADFSKANVIIEKLNQLSTGYPILIAQTLNKYVVEAIIYAIFGNTKKCSQTVSDALALSEESGVHLFDFMLIGHQISNSLNQNDGLKAKKLLKTLENWEGPLRTWDKSFYHFLKARTLLLSKDFQEAVVHAQITMKMEDKIGSPMGRSLTRMILAQILHAQGKRMEAKVLLEDVLKLSEEYKSKSYAIFALFLKAQFALSEGEETSATNWLHQAARLAKDTGYVNTYVDQPEATADLCVYAIRNQIEVEYFHHVIRVRQLVPSNPPLDLDNWPWPVIIYTLGQFRIDRDACTLEFVGKVQQIPLKLLKLIIALGGTGIPEEQLADILWPEADGYCAHRAFSTALYRLRQLLDIPDMFHVADGKVSIDKRLCWVDSWAFEKMSTEILVSKAISESYDRDKTRQKLERAITFYRGDFLKLEDWGAPVISEREKLRGLFIQLIDRIGKFLEERERWHEAIQLYKRGLAIDEFVEKFYQRMMICYCSVGQKGEALTVFERCRKIFLAAYGIEPGNKLYEIRSMITNRSD